MKKYLYNNCYNINNALYKFLLDPENTLLVVSNINEVNNISDRMYNKYKNIITWEQYRKRFTCNFKDVLFYDICCNKENSIENIYYGITNGNNAENIHIFRYGMLLLDEDIDFVNDIKNAKEENKYFYELIKKYPALDRYNSMFFHEKDESIKNLYKNLETLYYDFSTDPDIEVIHDSITTDKQLNFIQEVADKNHQMEIDNLKLRSLNDRMRDETYISDCIKKVLAEMFYEFNYKK